jgi:G3E family GTPase
VSDYATRIPIVVLTGFLGSGKTTLLNRLLRTPALADSAVLVNEFGTVGIDHHLVSTIEDRTIVLASGCVCCTLREDLRETILALHDQRARGLVPPFRRIIVETTGLADPVPILHTVLVDPQLRHHYRLGHVITTVDAVNGAAQLARFAEARKQVLVADRLVLTKTDLVAPPVSAALHMQLAHTNPGAALLSAADAGFDCASLLLADLERGPAGTDDVVRWLDDYSAAPRVMHTHEYDSFCLERTEPSDWHAFGVWLTLLLHTHGSAVLRVKGLLNVTGVPTPVVINGVQHVVHPPFHLAAWPAGDRRSRLVFIVHGLARARIEESFAVFTQLA